MILNINMKDIKKENRSKSKAGDHGLITKALNTKIQIRKDELSLAQKESFYSEASILLGSGLDIKTCLEVIISEQSKKRQKQLFQSIREKIINGSNLSESLIESKKISMYEYYTLKIGEESGRITEVLNQLADHYNKKIKQRRQVIHTFSYPVLILSTAILVVVFMMTFIVPLFEELFKRFQGELPALTRVVLKASDAVSNHIGLIGLTAGLFVALVYFFRHRLFFRKFTSKAALGIPVLKVVLTKIYLARFCQSMELLNAARIPILDSIQLIKKIIGFYPFEKALEEVEVRIINGGLLYEALREQKVFDPKIVSLTKVGEEVNQLNRIYKKLNEQYHEEVRHKIALLNSMLEPLMIMFIGFFVAIILISMYLPMFKMSNSMF